MVIDWTPIYKPERVRPPHIDDLIGIYQGETEDDFSATVDLSAVETSLNAAQVITVNAFEVTNDIEIADAITAMEAHIDANSTGETVNQGATDLKAAIAAIINAIAIDYADHKTKLATDVSNELPSTATISKEEVLGQIKTDLKAAIASTLNGGTNYACTRCGADGRYPASNDRGETSSTDKQCLSCDGLGRTGEENTPSATVWSATNESYISL